MAHSQAVELPLNTAPAPPTHPPTSVTVPEQGTGAGQPRAAQQAWKGTVRGGRLGRRPPYPRPAGWKAKPAGGHPASALRSPEDTTVHIRAASAGQDLHGAGGGGRTTGSRQAPSRGLAPSGELPRARGGGPALREDSRGRRTHQDKGRAVPHGRCSARPHKAGTCQLGPGKTPQRTEWVNQDTPPSERLALTCRPRGHEGQRVGAVGSPVLGDPPGSAGWRPSTNQH